jgi:hypothetical protein
MIVQLKGKSERKISAQSSENPRDFAALLSQTFPQTLCCAFFRLPQKKISVFSSFINFRKRVNNFSEIVQTNRSLKWAERLLCCHQREPKSLAEKYLPIIQLFALRKRANL